MRPERSCTSRSGSPIAVYTNGGPHDAALREEHQRDAHRVDGREHDVGAVQPPERREDGREVAAVSPGALEATLQRRARHPRPARGPWPLEVVSHRVPALGELIHPEERVARRGARLELERRTSVRRVAEEVEDGGHWKPWVR